MHLRYIQQSNNLPSHSKRWPYQSLISQACRLPSLRRNQLEKIAVSYKFEIPPWTCCCRGLPSSLLSFIDQSFRIHLLFKVQGCDQEHKGTVIPAHPQILKKSNRSRKFKKHIVHCVAIMCSFRSLIKNHLPRQVVQSYTLPCTQSTAISGEHRQLFHMWWRQLSSTHQTMVMFNF